MAAVASPDGGAEPPFMRMTPMEFDIQLQAAELVFRSVLEGKRLGVHPAENIDEWYRDVLGEAWIQQNNRQRQEVLRQMKAAGENTPEWVESLAHMGDIAWEVLEAGTCGERVRKLEDIDRAELIEQFKELFPKVRDSHFARCGAGDRLYGLRACIAILRTFARDAEVLDHCSSCLKLVITDHEYNRDGLAELSVPMPPAERKDGHVNIGWSFLRAALDAYMVQAGGQPHGAKPEDQEAEGPAGPPRLEVSVKIAECLLAAKSAPALAAQLQLLRKAMPANACPERRELQLMLPALHAKTLELIEKGPNPVLSELLEVLKSAGADEQSPAPMPSSAAGGGDGVPGGAADAAASPADDGAKGGVLRGLAAGMRGLLGRGST
mmetsp:Transcript_78248/g.221218  ORF Transcript_78248/g.221218 Transcript_78248/m.221218 type:complete len:380 (+) Transcript_78248:92-1231(+)